LGDGDGGARAANVVIELWIAATAAAQQEPALEINDTEELRKR
jgi:hypothetical protein